MYTWGQLRLLVRQTFPSVSLDRIDEALNTRYARILDTIPWLELEARGYIQTASAYVSSTDTVALTQGSASIVGVGTAWVTGQTGLLFFPSMLGPSYTFTFVDATHATLDRPYEGTTVAASGYWLVQESYGLAADFKAIRNIESAEFGGSLPLLSQVEIGDAIGYRDTLGDPQGYYLSTTNDAPRIQFYPRPLVGRAYPIVYEVSVYPLTDDNLTAYPLAFVRDAALLAGARAELYSEDPKGLNQAVAFEAKFEKELSEMVKVDYKKRPKRALQAADWMTAHRLRRLRR